jgi:trimeric autotransporter adhesin
MNLFCHLIRPFVAMSVLAMAACGGGGGGGGGNGNGTESISSGSLRLSVSAQAIKTLAFQWDAVPEATHYRLLEDVDGPDGSLGETLLEELPAGQSSHLQQEAFLPARVNARYRLQACHGNDCVSSAAVGIEQINRGIGYFKASNTAAGDEFGEGLAISADGQVLAVGAYREDGLNEGIDSTPNRGAADANVGAVYVFRRGATGWLQEAYIKPAHAQVGAQFGYRVALSGKGNVLLVGAPGDSSGGSGLAADPQAGPPVTNSGAVHVFERDVNGQWAQVTYMKAEAPAAEARFGKSLSLSQDGTRAAVGHPDGAGGGRASLYRRQLDGWEFHQVVQGSNTEGGDAFGEVVQLDPEGETLVVGAWGEDGSTDTAGTDNGASASGAVYVFRRDADSDVWDEVAYLKAPARRANGYFGYPVTLSSQGGTIAVGEPGDPTSDSPTVGRVHVFSRHGDAWVSEAAFLSSPQPQAAGAFGEKLALSADGLTLAIANPWEGSNGLGLGSVPAFDGLTPASGTVYLYRRGPGGAWLDPATIKAPNSSTDLYFGWSLALSADGKTLAAYASDHSSSTGIGGDMTDRSAYWAGAVTLY